MLGDMTATVSAIREGLGDLISHRLLPLSAACLVGALAATVCASWAVLHWLVPLIPITDGPLGWILRALTWLAGAAIVVVAISLSPSISMVIGGALFDVAAGRVEDELGGGRGRSASFFEGLVVSARIAIPALVLNLLAMPLVFVPVVHVFVFVLINGWLMGREYFTLAALRRVGWEEARALRRRAWPSILAIGVVASVIPLVAPLFGASAMTRLLRAGGPRA